MKADSRVETQPPVRPRQSGRLASRRPAMTLAEMTIAVLVLGAGLFFVSGWMERVRQRAKHDLAVRTLSMLDRALTRYHRATGAFPMKEAADSATAATVELLSHRRTRPLLLSLPGSVWKEPEQRTLVDPWGTPLRYIGPASDSPYLKANEGRPLFISAGPDRLFGDPEDADPAALGDNLRSDDPGPDGFHPQLFLRDMATTQETDRGEEDDRPDRGP